ncbi:MAG: Gfo/Idh/MocA family protein, partial [Candidatus Binatia bacterium]
MTAAPLGVAVVGCGDIAQRYGETLQPHESLRIVGATDLIGERADAFAGKYGGRSYASLDDVLGDDAVDAVCNLTIHQAHEEVIRRSLEAGKHVFSEKPLTLDPTTAQELVRLADDRGLRLGCAPSVSCGEAQQTFWKLVRDGAAGVPRVAYAEVNWGRPETWHGNPKPFYEVGAVVDVGVYPLTILTTIFGPARRVSAFGAVLLPERTTLDGEAFTLATPDFAVALVEWDDGFVARLTADFYVSPFTRQHGIELH